MLAILKIKRTHFDALHLLGVVAGRSGRFDEAARLIGEAISYSLIGTVALMPAWWLIVAGTVFFAIGSGLLEPALNGMISAAAGCCFRRLSPRWLQQRQAHLP